MKMNRFYKKSQGFTIIELSVIVSVIVLLAGLTMIASSHITAGVHKNTCISNIANAQKAMRSVSLIEGLVEGDTFSATNTSAIKSMYPGMECGAAATDQKDLPTGWGSYTIGSEVPATGNVFAQCKIKGTETLFQHAPDANKVGSW